MVGIFIKLFLFLFLFLKGLNANEYCYITHQSDKYDLVPYTELYFADPDQNSTIHDVLAKESSLKFEKLNQKVLTIPRDWFGSHTYWVRIKLKSRLHTTISYILDFSYGRFDTMELYIVKDQKIVFKGAAGDIIAPMNNLKYHSPLFPLKINPDEEISIFLKFKVIYSFVTSNISLLKKDDALETMKFRNLFDGAYYGILLVFSFYQLFIFIATRDRGYLYYVLYNASLGVFNISNQWYLKNTLPTERESLFFTILLISTMLALIFLNLFTKAFFGSVSNIKIILGMKKFLLYLCSSVVLGAIVFFNYDVVQYQFYGINSYELMSVLTIIVGNTLIIEAIIAYRKGYKASLYLLLAYATFTFGTFSYIGSRYGVFLYYTPIVESGMRIGTLVEMVMLSIALADRIRTLREEKEKLVGVEAYSQKLEQINQELLEAKEIAQNASEQKTMFLANVSHELRTPLNAIIGYSDLIHENAVDDNNDELAKDALRIKTAGKTLIELINDLLDLAKIEAQKMDVYPEKFDFFTLCQEIQDMVIPLVEKRNNTFVLECNAKIGTVFSDKAKIRQGLLNFLSNASKFTEKGTITLKIIEKDKILYCQVIDTGMGMTKKQMNKLFSDFAQADASISGKYGGTGLGLSLTKKFAELLGGNVNVSSESGKGSIFSFVFPRHYK